MFNLKIQSDFNLSPSSETQTTIDLRNQIRINTLQINQGLTDPKKHTHDQHLFIVEDVSFAGWGD